MAHPLNTGTIIEAVDFNVIQDILTEVLGVGENGYGFSVQNSVPVTDKEIGRAWHMRGLQYDLNQAYKHITNNYTATSVVVAGTTIINPALPTVVYEAAQFVEANRYTCHPSQYFVDPVTGATINTTDGTSTRTLGWGIGPDIQIQHKVNVTWASRLVKRYFFNAGGKFEWLPYYTDSSVTGNPLNDLDTEWANFINYLQNTSPWVYDRPTHEDWTTTATTYSSGTLRISVLADQETDASIRFTFSFYNNDTPDLVVVPSTGFWNIIV